MTLAVSIVEERNVIDDHLLNIIEMNSNSAMRRVFPSGSRTRWTPISAAIPPVADDEQYIVFNSETDGRESKQHLSASTSVE